MPSQFKATLLRKQTELDLLTTQKQELVDKHALTVEKLGEYMEARDIVNAVQLTTQSRIQVAIESAVSMALKAVFGDSYGFHVEYAIQRNKSEATLTILKGGETFNAEDECGGGIIDVVSLALRIALWSISKNRSAPVFILDEPGRFLSAEKAPLFGELLSRLSEILSVQFIMVSHNEALIETADRSYRVTQHQGVSTAEAQ